MSWWQSKSRLACVIAIGLALLVVFPFICLVINRPKSTREIILLDAHVASRRVIQERSAKSSVPGTFMPPVLPRRIDFTARSGEVDIYVVRLPSDPTRYVKTMMQLTDDLSAGHAPSSCTAQTTAQQGYLNIRRWPFGWAKFMVLLRSDVDNQGELAIHY